MIFLMVFNMEQMDKFIKLEMQLYSKIQLANLNKEQKLKQQHKVVN